LSKANKKRSRLIFRGVVLLLLTAAILFSIFSKDKVKVLAVGDKAPDFELVDLEVINIGCPTMQEKAFS